MLYKGILRDYTVFADDASFRGRIASYTPPELQPQVVEYRGGGMSGSIPIPMGLEIGDATLVTGGFEEGLVTAVGRVSSEIRVVCRGALISDGEDEQTLVHEIRGFASVGNLGTWQPGESAQTTITVNPTFFKIELDGQTIRKVDIRNNIDEIDGEDQNAAIRSALGL